MLLKRDGGLGNTPAMLKAAGGGEVMILLLGHQPDCQITVDVVIHLIEWRWLKLEVLKVLIAYGKTLEFTAEIRKALDEKLQNENDQETKALFYKLER